MSNQSVAPLCEIVGTACVANRSWIGESDWEQIRLAPGGHFYILDRTYTEFHDTGYRNAREISITATREWLVQHDVTPPDHIFAEIFTLKPAPKAALMLAPAEDPAPMEDEPKTPSELIGDLHAAFLLVLANGTADYETIPEECRRVFEQEVRAGTWAAHVEELKARCLEAAIDLPDSVVGETAHFAVDLGKRLHVANHNRLEAATRAVGACAFRARVSLTVPLSANEPVTTILSMPDVPLTAADLAKELGEDPKAVGTFLARYRKNNPGCAVETAGGQGVRRSKFMYYPSKVRDALRDFKSRRKRPHGDRAA